MTSVNQNSSSGSSSGSSASKTAIVKGMPRVYNQLLALNEQNYSNILDAHTQGMQNLAGQLPAIYAGYDTGKANVMRELGVGGGGWGVATPAAAQIQQNAANSFGQSQQAMMNSGMGNSTVLQGLRASNQLSAGQALAGLGSQLAQTAAGYESQFDLAKQGAMMQGLQQETGFTGDYMGDLGRYRFDMMGVPLTGQFSHSQSLGSQQSQGNGTAVDSPMQNANGGGKTPPMDTSGQNNGNNGPTEATGMPVIGPLSPSPQGGGNIYNWNAGGGGTSQLLNVPQYGNYAGSYGEDAGGGSSYGGFASGLA